MSLSIFSNSGCAYVIGISPCFLFTKVSTMPEPKGPGRYSATKAPKSSNTDGLKSLTSFFIPADSNWNTPSVSPSESILYVFLSSNGILLISSSIPFLSLIISRAWVIMVKFFKPKKSIFKRPIFSQSSFGYSVITLFSPLSVTAY